MKKFALLAVMLFQSALLFAQSDIEMADQMRSNGKIYVVVACVAIVLIGLLAYIFKLDRNLSKLEKNS